MPLHPSHAESCLSWAPPLPRRLCCSMIIFILVASAALALRQICLRVWAAEKRPAYSQLTRSAWPSRFARTHQVPSDTSTNAPAPQLEACNIFLPANAPTAVIPIPAPMPVSSDRLAQGIWPVVKRLAVAAVLLKKDDDEPESAPGWRAACCCCCCSLSE